MDAMVQRWVTAFVRLAMTPADVATSARSPVMPMRLTAVLMLFCSFLVPVRLTAGSGTTSLRWQDGEVVSRKTIPAHRTGLEYKYLYRLRSGDARYVVSTREPLKLELMAPVKFAPQGRSLVIKDADGRSCKAALIEKSKRDFRRWK